MNAEPELAPERFDSIRGAALDRIDRDERWFKLLIGLAGLVECAGLVGLFWLMDFGDRLHLLILIAALLVYMTLGLWTWALAAHASMNAKRILQSIEMLHRHSESSPSGPA